MKVLRGARVVDGTGAPASYVDVLIDRDRILSVGGEVPSEAEVVDLTGLVLAPGFIDPHTHLDCQILWDPDVSPSPDHGVTTVVMGNCGFTIAPTRPSDRETIIRMLENVEGMSAAALFAGIKWSFESFPEYLDAIDALAKRINVGALVGHSAVRQFTMGEAASERAATDDEVAEMKAIVREAMQAGALGFSSSLTEAHLGAGGRPVPSRFAALDELQSLAGALKDEGKGTIQLVTGSSFGPAECVALSEQTGRPLTWLGFVAGRGGVGRDGGAAGSARLDELGAKAGGASPQISCRPLVSQLTLTTFIPLVQISQAFRKLISATDEERCAIYASPEWREEAKAGISESWRERLADITVAETKIHAALIGHSLGEIGRETGRHPLDVMVDLGLSENLTTRFLMVLGNDDKDELAELLGDKRCVVGLSDAGAHVDQLCDAVYPTFMLSHWVRERKAVSLELAIWRLTGQPAELFGIRERGRIAAGYYADLVAFDPGTIGPGPLRRVWDWPGGADRLTAESIGLEHVWVNGVPVRQSGRNLDHARPGRLVRS